LRYGETVHEQLPGFRTSSARRTRGGPVLVSAAALSVLLLAAVLALRHRDAEPESAAPEVPTAPAVPTRAVPAAPSATPTFLVEQSSEWVVADGPIPTATPWPTLPPDATPTPRPQPSPTPHPAECVSFRWTSSQVFAPSAQVLVEIDADNRCNRDLGPLELWFEISGWRGGGLVQSVRGHPFERVRRGSSAIVAIGLPGSIDWYDEVRVEIVE
jgi:hypothetical protein